MLKNCCENKHKEKEYGTSSVHISVDITKIVKYLCCTGIIIVGIIFSSRCYRDMIKEGLIKPEQFKF